MENTTTNNTNIFTKLYRTRCMVTKGDTTILNLSALFTLIAVITAPWVAIVFLICGLVLGYRFQIRKHDAAFEESIDAVVKGAASNVQSTVENVKRSFTDSNSDNE